MPQSVIQRSFQAGELGPSLYSRVDLTQYVTGLKTCRNFMVMRHGGAANRPGSEFIDEVKDSDLRTYLLKFVFNAEQTYLIEAGAGYFRFIRNGAQIVVSSPPAWATIVTYNPGDLVVYLGNNYYCVTQNLNFPPTYTTIPPELYWHRLTADTYEIPTPYAAADLSTLQFVQSGDIVTITHPSYQPRELRRTGHTQWTLNLVTTKPSIDPPVSLSALPGAAGTVRYAYVVTSVKAETYEESIASPVSAAIGLAPTSALPNTLSWPSVVGAVEYNVYLDKDGNGAYGFIGIAKQQTSFFDIGYQPDFSVSPPVPRAMFESPNDYPATATYSQQRLIFARTNNNPEQVAASRTGSYKNFTISSPIQDDDAITFKVAGREVNEVRHMIEIGHLAILTAGGEWTIQGDSDGVLRPTAINPKQAAYNGASPVMPVVIGAKVIYVQARGGIVRDLEFDITQYAVGSGQTGYGGKDLTIYAPQLFEGFQIERMAFAQIPHSIAWAVRSDGQLLGLTYIPEEPVWGWHHHDTDGFYEDVQVIPEGDEDAVYVIVRRIINGQTKRYIERFSSRRVTEIQIDAHFLDSYLTYNGLNSSAATITFTSPSGNWTVNDEITVTSSASQFGSWDIGNAVDLYVAGVAICRVVIRTVVSDFVVKGYPDKTVPSVLRNTPLTSWAKAVDQVANLDHLEGKTVSILANGNVLAQKVVTGGAITLDRPYNVIHVGLPIIADLETLDMDSAQAQIRDKKKLVTSVSLLVAASRGIFAGPDPDNLTEFKPDAIVNYGDVQPLFTGLIEINTIATWSTGGRMWIRQSDPLPLSIHSIIPVLGMGG